MPGFYSQQDLQDPWRNNEVQPQAIGFEELLNTTKCGLKTNKNKTKQNADLQ